MELLGVIGSLLPLGVASALSSVPIAVAIALLLSEKASSKGLAYLIGQFAGALLVTLAVGSSLSLVPSHLFGRGRTLVIVGIAELLVGAFLILYGVHSLRSRRPASRLGASSWLQKLDGVGPWAALGIGLVLNVRPKALLLNVAAGLAIGVGDLSTVEGFSAAAVYGALASSIVAGAVAAHFARPDATRHRLEQARYWLEEHGRLVTAVVTIVIGVVILGDGLGRIAS